MIQPSRRRFLSLARLGRKIPIAACLPLETNARRLFEALQLKAPHVLLESARCHPVTGRFSLIVGEPFGRLTAKGDQIQLQSKQGIQNLQGNPFRILQELLSAHRAVRLAGFPPFVGGAVGFIGFDAYQYWERLPSRACDDLHLPDLDLLLCHEAIVLDHLQEKLWLIVLADPQGDPGRAYDEAVAKVETLLRRATRSSEGEGSRVKDEGGKAEDSGNFLHPSSRFLPPVSSTHTRASFEAMVREAKRFIAQGQIYQANLSQRFTMNRMADPWALYQRLTTINPSPFAAFADFQNVQVVSASPERLLRVSARQVETRPIAGTRPRGRNAVETAQLRRELILNEKERAEHLMLVDLERNDLGRVSRYGSVRVDDLMALEEYSHVIHIVSNITGTLRPRVGAADVLEAVFPGGTITGCPKIRCLEIIDALEPVRRQLYTGSLGYFSFTGDLDFNLLIRTALITKEGVHVQVGAGIVADSDPSMEYEETLHKAEALMEAFHEECKADPELVAAGQSTASL